MFKNKISEKAKNAKLETVNEFLARNGEINKFMEGDSGKRKIRIPNKIDAQKLLNNCKKATYSCRCKYYLKNSRFASDCVGF